jgi:hypothetical protein
MARDLLDDPPAMPDFEHWQSPETRVRWERGLAIVAGMIGVVLVFFLLLSVLPIAPDEEDEPARGARVPPQATQSADAGASPGAAATQAPPPAEQRFAAVSRQFPNVRRRPSLDGEIVTTLRQGQRVEVIGRTADGQWLQIIHPENAQQRVWVSADMLEVTGDPRTLPVVRPD